MEQEEQVRRGILGGTFDPIHIGHLRLAEEVGEELALEKVYLIPAASPPHKNLRPVTPFPDRLAMTRIAAKASPLFETLDLEGRRQGYSYSIETLRDFHRIFPHGLELFFILGMDAFLEIETWKEHERLFDYANLVVIKRPGFPSDLFDRFVASLGATFEWEGDFETYRAPSGNRLIYKEATLMDISSSAIRERVAKGKSIRFLVPEAVRTYVIEKRLYRTHEDA